MTQEEIFKMAMSKDRTELTNIWQTIGEDEREYFKNVADCYNLTVKLIKTLRMTTQQKDIFLNKASKNLYTEQQLNDIGFCICALYKSEYDIKEDAEEKLNLLCDINNTNIRSSQIHVGIVKNLTLDEIKECLEASDEEIAEITKQVFCRHYNKIYTPSVKEQEMDDNFR